MCESWVAKTLRNKRESTACSHDSVLDPISSRCSEPDGKRVKVSWPGRTCVAIGACNRPRSFSLSRYQSGPRGTLVGQATKKPCGVLGTARSRCNNLHECTTACWGAKTDTCVPRFYSNGHYDSIHIPDRGRGARGVPGRNEWDVCGDSLGLHSSSSPRGWQCWGGGFWCGPDKEVGRVAKSIVATSRQRGTPGPSC